MFKPGIISSKASSVTYATWNPSDKSANITLSGGDLTMSNATNAWSCARSTIGKSSGKWYWEITNSTTSNPYWSRGIGKSTATLSNHVGVDANAWGWYNDGTSSLRFNNNMSSSYGSLSSSGDVIGFALDMDSGTLTCYENNVSQGTMYSGLSGTFYPQCAVYGAGPTITANFGASALTYSPPAGFNAGLYN